MSVNRRIILSLIAICAVVVAAFGAHVATDPLRKANPEVREWLLTKAPLGSSFGTVRAVAIRDHWLITYEIPFNAPSPFLGKRSIGFEVGHYGWPFPMHVTSKWRFVDDKLVEVQVEKIGDGF